jgi:hypothetical protein
VTNEREVSKCDVNYEPALKIKQGVSHSYYKKERKYSDPPNTGPSGIQMVIFRTLFVSGIQMVLAANLLKTI